MVKLICNSAMIILILASIASSQPLSPVPESVTDPLTDFISRDHSMFLGEQIMIIKGDLNLDGQDDRLIASNASFDRAGGIWEVYLKSNDHNGWLALRNPQEGVVSELFMMHPKMYWIGRWAENPEVVAVSYAHGGAQHGVFTGYKIANDKLVVAFQKELGPSEEKTEWSKRLLEYAKAHPVKRLSIPELAKKYELNVYPRTQKYATDLPDSVDIMHYTPDGNNSFTTFTTKMFLRHTRIPEYVTSPTLQK